MTKNTKLTSFGFFLRYCTMDCLNCPCEILIPFTRFSWSDNAWNMQFPDPSLSEITKPLSNAIFSNFANRSVLLLTLLTPHCICRRFTNICPCRSEKKNINWGYCTGVTQQELWWGGKVPLIWEKEIKGWHWLKMYIGHFNGNRSFRPKLFCPNSESFCQKSESFCPNFKVLLQSKNSLLLFLSILNACLFDTSQGKSQASNFSQRLFFLSESLGFYGLPLFTFKTDRLDFRGLDLG